MMPAVAILHLFELLYLKRFNYANLDDVSFIDSLFPQPIV